MILRHRVIRERAHPGRCLDGFAALQRSMGLFIGGKKFYYGGMLPPWMNPGDLAPGDARCAGGDWQRFRLHRITSPRDPEFNAAFGALWNEFGRRGEMETRAVIAARLDRGIPPGSSPVALLYELLMVTRNGEFVGVRDHTAIVCRELPGAVVHMSHNLVAVPWRRSGIAGWLRALPVGAGRACLQSQKRDPLSPVTLVGEMESADPDSEERMVRLMAYEKAGAWKIDPRRIAYLQPDFRDPAEIDATGGIQPVPLDLIIRRVGRETERTIAAKEVRQLIHALYSMYASTFRDQDMAPLREHLESLPDGDDPVGLIPPTRVTR